MPEISRFLGITIRKRDPRIKKEPEISTKYQELASAKIQEER
jgi:hypothetical protein